MFDRRRMARLKGSTEMEVKQLESWEEVSEIRESNAVVPHARADQTIEGVRIVRSLYADCSEREELCIEIRPQGEAKSGAEANGLRIFWSPWLQTVLKMSGEVIESVTDEDVAEHIQEIVNAGLHPFFSLHLRDLRKIDEKIQLRNLLWKEAKNTGNKAKKITVSGNDETPYRWVLFADIDCGETQEAQASHIKRAPDLATARAAIEQAFASGLPQPSLFTCSGGGYHLYWFLEAPWSCEDAAYRRVVSKAYQAIGFWDMSVTDAARVARIPATFHPKRGVFGEVISYSPDLRYTPSAFDALSDKPAPTRERKRERAGVEAEVKSLKVEEREALVQQALDATGLEFNEQATSHGSIFVLPQGCPVCDSEAASIVHVTYSGRYKCKRASCVAFEKSETKGLAFDSWVPRLVEASKAAEILTAWRMGHEYMDLDDHARVAEEFAAENPDIIYVREHKDFKLFDGIRLASIRRTEGKEGGVTFDGVLRSWLRDKEARELEVESQLARLDDLWRAEIEFVLGPPPRVEDEAAWTSYDAAVSSYVYGLGNRKIEIGQRRYVWKKHPGKDLQFLEALIKASKEAEDRTPAYIAAFTTDPIPNIHGGAELDVVELRQLRVLRKWSKQFTKDGSVDVPHMPFEFSRVARYRKYLQGDVRPLAANIASLKVYSAEELDQKSNLINVANGTIELLHDGSYVLREARVSDLLTKSTNVKLENFSSRVAWLRFLDEVSCGDKEWIQYVQCIAGQALYGKNVSQQIFFFHGSGRNGKGVMTEVLMHVLGEYAGGSDAGRITKQKNKGRFENIELWGKRLFIFSDAGSGSAFEEDRLKAWTGGDPIPMEQKGKDVFMAQVVATPIVNSSGQIKINAATGDVGIEERLVIVPFDWRVPREQRDPHLAEKLKEEAPAILRWALEGWKLFCENGQRMPSCKRIDRATREYFHENDWRQDFIEDCCEFIEGDEETLRENSVTTPELFSAYKMWAMRSGIKHAITQDRFMKELRREPRVESSLKGAPYTKEGNALPKPRRNDGTRPRIWWGMVLTEEVRGKVPKVHGLN